MFSSWAGSTDCEARITVLENVGRAWREVQRLRGLATRADEEVADRILEHSVKEEHDLQALVSRLSETS